MRDRRRDAAVHAVAQRAAEAVGPVVEGPEDVAFAELRVPVEDGLRRRVPHRGKKKRRAHLERPEGRVVARLDEAERDRDLGGERRGVLKKRTQKRRRITKTPDANIAERRVDGGGGDDSERPRVRVRREAQRDLERRSSRRKKGTTDDAGEKETAPPKPTPSQTKRLAPRPARSSGRSVSSVRFTSP